MAGSTSESGGSDRKRKYDEIYVNIADIKSRPVVDHCLAVAYCLRALETQEAEPISTQISQDLECALDLWLYNSHPDFPEDEELSPLLDSILILLYNIVDLVQLKGFRKLSEKAFMMIIRILERKLSTEKWLNLLWESRRLRHGLCASPISDAFIQCSPFELSKVDIWTSHLQNNPILLKGFQQNFSFLFASSAIGSSCLPEASFQRITIEDVKSAAEKLSNDSAHSTFNRGSLYYDLCPWLVANGQLGEALSFAWDTRTLYLRLCKEKFGDNFRNNEVNESVSRKIVQFHGEPWDFNDCYVSPWNSVQCYLQSILQLGLIYKITGHIDLAKRQFTEGKHISGSLHLPSSHISGSLHLPSFIIAFCSELGKLYIENGKWDLAEKELKKAKDILNDNNTTLCCSKCKLIFEATLDQYHGEMRQSKNEGSAKEHISFYRSVLAKLEGPEWKNSVSCPEEEGSWYDHCTAILERALLGDFINLKWEFVRRKFMMKLLTQLVKCLAYVGDEIEGILLKRMTMLSRNTFNATNSAITLKHFRQIVTKVIAGDMFAVERAEILRDICLYSRNVNTSKLTRSTFHNKACISFKDLASWLMVAFVLSREVPDIFRKVSQLLAVIYVISASRDLPYVSKTLGENAWASYFHQASIGTHDTHTRLLLIERCKLSRSVPDATEVLAECVQAFLGDLSSTTVICITLLGNEYASFLTGFFSPSVRAWILLSRLTFESEPIVALLPLDPILEDEIGQQRLPKYKSAVSCSLSSWDSTALFEVAPAFKNIMKENAMCDLEEDTTEQKQLWMNRKEILNCRLGQLLRSSEESWFGSWKFLLLGELLNCKNFDSLLERLVKELKSECKLEVDEGLIKVILGGTRHVCEPDKLKHKKDCYIAKVGHCDQGMSAILLNAADTVGVSYDKAFQLMRGALNELDANESNKRKPIILVLDHEVQMFPWENIPILRQLEVYRMPSVNSISAFVDTGCKGCKSEEDAAKNCLSFPSIDPFHAFYILNPDGTLPQFQSSFEDWFKENNMKGITGLDPSKDSWASALEKHDLFIFCGHGCGWQYFPLDGFSKLNKCGAAVLLGCESSTTILRGNFAPLCVPLEYLEAGSPAVVGNLWNISAVDICRFGKHLLQSWLVKRHELEKESLDHAPTLGAFMAASREACRLRYLTGAAPVLYGVPTQICVKKNVSNLS